MSSKKVLLLVGPTAVGKTRLSLLIAQKLGAEIISADSRQVYKFLDIGTAKPSLEDRKRVPYHFIDIKFPDEYYSAGQFGREARIKIKTLQTQDKIPLVVGGSGFYIKALVDGLSESQVSNPQIKARLKQRLNTEGLKNLYEQLEEVDPVWADRIHPNDTQRILRALEVFEITGTPFSHYHQQPPIPADFTPFFIGLTQPRASLYRVIEERVDSMLQLGLVEEVKRIQRMGYGSELNALQTVGYKEVFDYLEGHLQYDEMIRLIKKNTRNYAKRQLTWFQADSRINWVELEDDSNFELLARKLVDRYVKT